MAGLRGSRAERKIVFLGGEPTEVARPAKGAPRDRAPGQRRDPFPEKVLLRRGVGGTRLSKNECNSLIIQANNQEYGNPLISLKRELRRITIMTNGPRGTVLLSRR